MTAKSCAFSSLGCIGYGLLFWGLPFYFLTIIDINDYGLQYLLLTVFSLFLAFILLSFIINRKKGLKRAALIGLILSVFAPFSPLLLIHGYKYKEPTHYEGCKRTLKSLSAAGGRYFKRHGKHAEDIDTLIPYYYYADVENTDEEIEEIRSIHFSSEDKERLFEYCSEINLSVNENNALIVTGIARDEASSTIVIGPTN